MRLFEPNPAWSVELNPRTEAAAILDSGLATASILDFKPRLGNRCSTIVATTNGPPADGRGGRRRGQDTTKAA